MQGLSCAAVPFFSFRSSYEKRHRRRKVGHPGFLTAKPGPCRDAELIFLDSAVTCDGFVTDFVNKLESPQESGH